MPRQPDEILPSESISRISRLEVQARQIVEGFLSGQHRSPYFGQSIEFVQHREYVPGDEIKRIDWKVWSKTDKYYIKQYEEETNLRTTLLVDGSESMQFGSSDQSKYDYACSIAACLTYLLLRQQDAVSLAVFDEEVRQLAPSRSQHNHLGTILSVLANAVPAQKTRLSKLLQKVANEKTEKGMVVLVSDLFAPVEDLFKGLRMLKKRGHEVLIFHVLDDQELDFDYTGTTRFEGLESAGELTCDPKSLRDGYQAAMQSFLDEVRLRCSRNMIDYQTIRTSEPLDAVLRHYMNHRVGLRRSLRS